LVLSYSAASRKAAKEFSYEEEVKFLISNDKRNRFIAKLAASTKGNTLVLFSRVETHGELIYNLIQKYTDRPVYFIYGGTDVDIREDVRIKINSINDGIIVASSQIFSTGINIPSLQNIIFTHPSKSKIRVLQSIGRVLRLSINKSGPAILFDIVDDLKFRNKTNFSMKHFLERAKLYVQENFNYKIVNVELEK
jgi:superfamily II DNA or RNA helicase